MESIQNSTAHSSDTGTASASVSAPRSILTLTFPVTPLPGATLCRDIDAMFRADTGLRTLVIQGPGGVLFLVDRREFDDQMVARLGYGRTLFSQRPVQEVFSPGPPLALSPRCTVLEAYTLLFSSFPDYPYLDVLVHDGREREVRLLPVTQLLQQTSRVYAHLAQHDPLTRLPNRTFLADQLASSLSERGQTPAVALVFLDLDRFKVINDSLGHDAGDTLLCEVARRLADAVRPRDVVARLGGDEFAVLLRDVDSPDGARQVAERIRERLEQPVTVRDTRVISTASVGIAVADRQSDPSRLMREADIAMYQSKQRGGNSVEMFEPVHGSTARQRFDMESELRRALEQRELAVYYQPIVALPDRTVVGFEALVRWPHPTLGLLAPMQFLPVAQEAGLLPSIDRHVLAEVCQFLQRAARAPDDLPRGVHVNVSVPWFESPSFIADVMEAIQRFSIQPRTLGLELSEEGVIRNSGAARQTVQALRDSGVRVAIDDFGTGYSSIDQLTRFEFDILKLDRRFVAQLGGGRREKAIVRCLLDLADAVAVEAIAEGVELPIQADELMGLGCHLAQGYLYGHPQAEPAWQATTEPGATPGPAADF